MRVILPFLFSLYDELACFPMLISYDCKQSIAKFAIKIGVVIYKLVKQLRLIVVVDPGY
jgi:hypothetical protein